METRSRALVAARDLARLWTVSPGARHAAQHAARGIHALDEAAALVRVVDVGELFATASWRGRVSRGGGGVWRPQRQSLSRRSLSLSWDLLSVSSTSSDCGLGHMCVILSVVVIEARVLPCTRLDYSEQKSYSAAMSSLLLPTERTTDEKNGGRAGKSDQPGRGEDPGSHLGLAKLADHHQCDPQTPVQQPLCA